MSQGSQNKRRTLSEAACAGSGEGIDNARVNHNGGELLVVLMVQGDRVL